MIVFSYDPDTRDYLGPTDAFESPLEPGVIHHPAFTTPLIPPNHDATTQTCKFVNEKWLVNVKTKSPLSNDPSADEILEAKRTDLLVARNKMLDDSDWLVARHQDERLGEEETTLTAEEFKELLAYRKALRDLSSSEDFPEVKLPIPPFFIGIGK
jgi:hypothetical protein